MSTIELYNALVKAGVEDSKAKAVSESLVTFDDAKHFATKEDLAKLEIKIDLIFKVHSAMLVGILILLVGQYFIR